MTELLLAVPPSDPVVPRRIFIWSTLVVIIAVAGGVAIMVAFRKAEKLSKSRAPRTAAAVAQSQVQVTRLENQFEVSAVAIHKPAGSLAYAFGEVQNVSINSRKQVKIELQMLDSAGTGIGSTFDATPLIRAGERWRFRAPLVDSRAVSAKVLSVTEQ